jgi:hypothetical protein
LPHSVSGETGPKTILDESHIKSSPNQEEDIRFSRRPREIFEDI